MKKQLFFAASALVMLASCSSESVDFTQADVESQQNNAIEFGTYLGKTGSTRAGTAGSITTSSLQTGTHKNDGFGVFGYNTGATAWSSAYSTAYPNFMYNEQVTWNSTKWEYAPVKYWPNGIDAGNTSGSPSKTASESAVQQVSFFAYAPYIALSDLAAGTPSSTVYGITALTGNATAGDPKVTYKYYYTSGPVYDLGATNNVDLLWGLAGVTSYNEADNSDPSLTSGTSYNVDLTKPDVDDKVTFLFKHALAKFGGYDSKSGIKVTADFDGNNTSTATTAGYGSKDDATLITLNSITIANASTSTTPNGGVFDITTGTWDTSTAGTISFSNSYSDISTNSYLNSVVWEPSSTPTNTGSGWNIAGVDATAKDVFVSATDPLYFVPGVSGQTIKVTVQYTVRTYDANISSTVSGEGTWSKVTQTISNEVSIAALAPNHYYTLIIHLGLTSVKFAASVSDWESADSENQVIWLPSNVTE